MQPTPDFRIVFDASPNAYVLLDRQLRFVDANRAYFELTASRLDQQIGRGMFELFPNEPRQANNKSARLLRSPSSACCGPASKSDRLHLVSRREGAGR